MDNESTLTAKPFEAPLPLSERTKFIRDKIGLLIDLVSPPPHYRDGFSVVQTFNTIDDIEAGSFQINFTGDENGQLLHLLRFYGKPLPDGSAPEEGSDKDKAYIVELQWSKQPSMSNGTFNYSEWDMADPKIKGELPNTPRAQAKIDESLRQFKKVFESDSDNIEWED